MIAIEKMDNGYVLTIGYPESSPEKKLVFREFLDAVNQIGWYFSERDIGEKIVWTKIKD